MMAPTPHVLLMAYGTPARLDEVEAYYTHIRHGRSPAPEQLAHLLARYEAIGGLSPLREITRAQADALEAELRRRRLLQGDGRVHVGFKHTQPFVADTVRAMAQAGITRAVSAVLAPHYSAMSVGMYIREASEAGFAHGVSFAHVRQWHMQPAYLDALRARLAAGLAALSIAQRERVRIIFSAHSLPERIVAQGDPYPEQLLETVRALVVNMGPVDWVFNWQSAGRTEELWLGPDILEGLRQAASDGCSAVLSCPIGFVADHLEVLYDLDIEASAEARRLGLHFARTASLNADGGLANALADAIEEAWEATFR